MKNSRFLRENSWCMYDWGNSAFVTTIIAAVLPIYFAETVCGNNSVSWSLFGKLLSTEPGALWGYSMSFAALLVAVLAPIFGAAADVGGKRKQFLGIMAAVGVIASAFLAFAGAGDIWLVVGLLIIGQIGFSGANVFYNSLLVPTTIPERRDLISARGYSLGYLGGGILLAVNMLMIMQPQVFGFADAGIAIKYVFVSVAVWWAVFSIPLFLYVPEGTTIRTSFFSSLKHGVSTLISTFRHIRTQKNTFRFLLSFLLYNDGVQTVIIMATIFGKTVLHLETGDLIGALLLTQIIGVPSSLFYGWCAKKFGSKKLLFIGLAGYMCIISYGYFMQTSTDFIILAGLVGVFMGGLQAVSRSFYSKLIPQDLSAEYFGFFSISQRFASIFGPLIFALVLDITGNARFAIISLAVLFAAGAILLAGVKEPRSNTA